MYSTFQKSPTPAVSAPSVSSGSGRNPKAILDEAGYDTLEELQEEIKDQREEYKSASGAKKARAKEDLDEMMDVLAQYNASINSSGGAAPQKQVQDIYVFVLHMHAGMYLLLQ